MMHRTDVVDVLTAVAAGTGRDIGDTDVQLWQQVMGDVPKQFALDAVLTHFRERPGIWLEPGHIVQQWKDHRRDQLSREPDEMREARQAALDARLVEDIEELAQSKEIPGPQKITRPTGPNPLDIPCPWCKATTGKACVIPGSTQLTTNPHPSRTQAVQPKKETP